MRCIGWPRVRYAIAIGTYRTSGTHIFNKLTCTSNLASDWYVEKQVQATMPDDRVVARKCGVETYVGLASYHRYAPTFPLHNSKKKLRTKTI